MLSKKILIVSVCVFMLNACGGGGADTNNASDETTITELSIIDNQIDLSGVIANNITPKTNVSSIVSSTNINFTNAQAEITLLKSSVIVEGNITFLLEASDDDGISEINLVLSNVDKVIALCSQDCGVNFDRTIIGLNPYFYGEQAGDVQLEIWLTDNLGNQVLTESILVSWQPHKITGVTATRDAQTINITWQANSELNRYNVYLATEFGLSPQTVDALDNGQKFLSLVDTEFTFTDALPEKSYQILITGVDGSGESGFSEIFNIATINGGFNFAPIAVTDSFEIDEGQALENNVLTNDINTNNGNLFLNIDQLIQPQHGILTINEDGEFTYIPTANFNGTDSFTYQVENELGLTDNAIVDIIIHPITEHPIAQNDEYLFFINQTLVINANNGLLSNDTNVTSAPLQVNTTPTTTVQNGTLILQSDGSFSYQPNEDFSGVDSFTYLISNDQGLTATAQVILSQTSINTAPQAIDDQFTINEDVNFTLFDVLANDIDSDLDNLIISDASVDIGSVNIVNGQIQYSAPQNTNGVASITYRISDGNGGTDTGTVYITINAINDSPTAVADTITINEDSPAITIDVLENDIDPDGDSLTITNVSEIQGTAEIVNEQIVFTPFADINGIANLNYSISDENGGTDTGILTITIIPINDSPTANDDTIAINEDESILINASADDIDGDTLTITEVTANVGTVSIVNGQIQYTPSANYSGDATIIFTVSDGNGGFDTGTLSIIIIPVNDAPVALPQSFNITDSATNDDVIGMVIATDIEDEALSYSLESGDVTLFNIHPDTGVLTVNGLTPFDSDLTSEHSVVVKVSDNGSPIQTTTVDVTINISNEELIPVESPIFGRLAEGNFNFTVDSSGGEINDSVQLGENIYFVGYSNNTDQDIYITSYNISGPINTTFGNNGVKVFDFSNDEKATAIASDGTDLFVAYSSFNGTNTEVCLLKMDISGTAVLSDNLYSGIHCTEESSTLIVNDLIYVNHTIQAVGKKSLSGEDDSLWISYDTTSLNYQNSSPTFTDVSGANLDDEAFSLQKDGNNNVMVVGSTTSDNDDKDSYIRLLVNGSNQGGFNSGSELILDISGDNTDDELLAIDIVNSVSSGYIAFLGGYITEATGEKEASIINIYLNGNYIETFGIEGIATYNIDGNSDSVDGGAEITGLTFDSTDHHFIISGTTGKDIDDTLFTARISSTDGALDTTYASSGINIISGIDGTQVANNLTIDTNDSLWVSGVNNTSNEPFIAAVDSTSALLTNFSEVGYLNFSTGSDADAQSLQILQLTYGIHAGKYIFASAVDSSLTTLVLTRLTNTGSIDTTFGTDGHQDTTIDLSTSEVTLIEDVSGNIIVVGSHNATSGEEEGFVAKFSQDGILDTSFAIAGIYDTTTLTANLPADWLRFTHAAIDSNNNIVAVGSTASSIIDGLESSFIVRLGDDGILDTDFNNEGAITGTITGDSNERYETVFIDNSDSIFAGGKTIAGDISDLIVIKYGSTGVLDTTFAAGGTYLGHTAPDGESRLAKILTDSSNNLYLIANKFTVPNAANITKLSSLGILDTTFATDGIEEYLLADTGDTRVHDAVIDSTGKILLSGIANDKGMLARISVDGSLDSTFGFNGAGYFESELCTNEHTFTSIILQTDTQIVVSNTCNNGSAKKVSTSKFNFYNNGIEP